MSSIVLSTTLPPPKLHGRGIIAKVFCLKADFDKIIMQSTSSPSTSSPQKGRPGPFGLSEHPLLPMAEVGKVNRQSQLRGTTTGITTGLIGGM